MVALVPSEVLVVSVLVVVSSVLLVAVSEASVVGSTPPEESPVAEDVPALPVASVAVG